MCGARVALPGGTMRPSSNVTVEVSEALDPTTLEAPDGQ
jgi:hypothetical protein